MDGKSDDKTKDDGSELKYEIEHLKKELTTVQQELNKSAEVGLGLLNEKENLKHKYELVKQENEQSKKELQELREAWNKAVNEQRISATTVFEKEVQLMNDSDALAASFSHAKQEIEKDLKQTKSQLESAINDRDRYLTERDEAKKKIIALEQERKTLKTELKDSKSRETKLLNENSELEEENVSLEKQVSNLRSAQVEFESSKHEIQRLQDDVVGLNSQLEEMVTLRRITERQMQEALEALQSEREQKYALRKELDKRNTTDPLINWTSLAALKGSPHLTNLALRSFGSQRDRSSLSREANDISPNGFPAEPDGTTFSDAEPNFDVIHDLEMPSIEGSLFDEVHLTEIKKLQQNLEDKENQRSNLNTKLIEIQHKLDSRNRQVEEVEKKLVSICSLVEDIYNESEIQKLSPSSPIKLRRDSLNSNNDKLAETKGESSDVSTSNEVTSTTNDSQISRTSPIKKSNILDDFDNIYSHLEALFAEYKSHLDLCIAGKDKAVSVPVTTLPDLSLLEIENDKKYDVGETPQCDDVQGLRDMLYKKNEQLKQLRTILRSNRQTAEVALMNLKSKYDMEKAIVAETMLKLRLDHKRLSEDAATFASLRSHFSARIEEYNTEIEKLQSKLQASEQEKNTLNSILRMAIEQKVMLTQKLEALEMDRENNHEMGGNNHSGGDRSGQQPRSNAIRGRGGISGGRGLRSARTARSGGNERR